MKKGIEQLRADLKAKKLSYHFGECGAHGCRTIEALHIDTPFPLGTVWYRWVGNKTIDILGCYVVDFARRCRVLTRMVETLLKAYPSGVDRIMTTTGNRYSKPWLKKCGFVQDESGDWVKVLKKKK